MPGNLQSSVPTDLHHPFDPPCLCFEGNYRVEDCRVFCVSVVWADGRGWRHKKGNDRPADFSCIQILNFLVLIATIWSVLLIWSITNSGTKGYFVKESIKLELERSFLTFFHWGHWSPAGKIASNLIWWLSPWLCPLEIQRHPSSPLIKDTPQCLYISSPQCPWVWP